MIRITNIERDELIAELTGDIKALALRMEADRKSAGSQTQIVPHGTGYLICEKRNVGRWTWRGRRVAEQMIPTILVEPVCELNIKLKPRYGRITFRVALIGLYFGIRLAWELFVKVADQALDI